jgi:uncharacterized protein YjcR
MYFDNQLVRLSHGQPSKHHQRCGATPQKGKNAVNKGFFEAFVENQGSDRLNLT